MSSQIRFITHNPNKKVNPPGYSYDALTLTTEHQLLLSALQEASDKSETFYTSFAPTKIRIHERHEFTYVWVNIYK